MIDILKNEILHVEKNNFEALALKLFDYQAKNCEVYAHFLKNLKIKIKSIDSIEKIPFLPIGFFKTQQILTQYPAVQTIFESSGTTGSQTSRHGVADLSFYKKISQSIFEKKYGPLENYYIIAMLPSYLERGNSSLVYMIQHFIEATNSSFSGFYLNDYEAIMNVLHEIKNAKMEGKKILLWGVTFAMLELAEAGYDFSELKNELVVLETGGMKGRKKEIQREELYKILKKGFGVSEIHSEYGMTELLSQAYSHDDAIFEAPNTMKVVLREVNDPFTLIPNTLQNKTGGINIIDLANIQSCSFIETQDLGQLVGQDGQFKVLGRFDNADLRGCNLLIN